MKPVDSVLYDIPAEKVCCARFIAKVDLKFMEHAFVTSVVDVGYDSRVLHSQHVFLLSRHLLFPSQEEGEKAHLCWYSARQQATLKYLQLNDPPSPSVHA